MLSSSRLVAFVATKDPVAAKRFYGDKLGLALLEETPFALVFAVRDTTLRVQKVASVVTAAYTTLGWEVQDISAVARSLRAAGVRFERFQGLEQDAVGIWTAPDGTRVAWFKDPDGNLLSLSEGEAS